MTESSVRPARRRLLSIAALLVLVLVPVLVVVFRLSPAPSAPPKPTTSDAKPADPPGAAYERRQSLYLSEITVSVMNIETWSPDAALSDYAAAYTRAIPRGLEAMDRHLAAGGQSFESAMMTKAFLLNARGDPRAAYRVLETLEERIKGTPLEREMRHTILFYKGVTGLRIGENENCVMCRGVSACIFPLDPSAIHINPEGSRLAVGNFTEHLQRFPDDPEVKWLLNLAHMTLGEYPDKVDPRYRLDLSAYTKSEFDIGRFHDVSHRVGFDRLNQSGGVIMDDFDGDGLLDIVVTDWAPNGPMAFYRNKGDGTFEDRTEAAGLKGQTGGLYCVQTDYNNDGHLDVFIPRGAWMPARLAMRPSLLRNNGNGTFTDVTHEAGLQKPLNSISATWADYDNDGRLDLFVCCDRQPCVLYRNKGNGTFEEVAARAGLPVDLTQCLGATWIDFDNDGFPDLFCNIAEHNSRLYRNNKNGTFTDVTKEMGIDGPNNGFSCWAFDFDNDGYLDIFAATFSHTLEDVVNGLLNRPHIQNTAKLWRNLGGKGFQDVTKEAGLDKVYSPMGSNFGDLDNDGYLDFYLGTGDPNLSTLVPNRLFKNVSGKRFSEITSSSGTGHLQKGHGVAFGDWRRCGSVDLFVEMGGAMPGDPYHNVLFQNPGHGNNWLNLKLVGVKSNKAALGARIKVVTAGAEPRTVYRHVSSGSSFGANPLEQHIGLGKAERVALVEVYWPTSGTTQVFRDIPANRAMEIIEGATAPRARVYKAVAVPR